MLRIVAEEEELGLYQVEELADQEEALELIPALVQQHNQRPILVQ